MDFFLKLIKIIYLKVSCREVCRGVVAQNEFIHNVRRITKVAFYYKKHCKLSLNHNDIIFRRLFWNKFKIINTPMF